MLWCYCSSTKNKNIKTMKTVQLSCFNATSHSLDSCDSSCMGPSWTKHTDRKFTYYNNIILTKVNPVPCGSNTDLNKEIGFILYECFIYRIICNNTKKRSRISEAKRFLLKLRDLFLFWMARTKMQ